ncbi:MAG TPA: histidine kinase [Anaerolineales bacterium]|nr:histidine kinase [Anaerolineales bacterium]
MKEIERSYGYQGGYRIGFIMIGVVALRAILFYQGQSNLSIVMLLIMTYAMLYTLEPWLSKRFHWPPYLYFPLQTAIVMMLSSLHPFLDFHTVLYFPLCIQVFRVFSRPAALGWSILFGILLTITVIPGLGLWEGLALILLNLASGMFLISYDFLYLRTQSNQAESQRLLADLQMAHEKLQEQAVQAEKLATARERNQLARELHDSVSQVIFSITLTSQSARLLLERNPARVPEEIERLREMTSSALAQLRSLIAELRLHEKIK